eukprot:12159859-Alexandrium_andersonii.AAC.1
MLGRSLEVGRALDVLLAISDHGLEVFDLLRERCELADLLVGNDLLEPEPLRIGRPERLRNRKH